MAKVNKFGDDWLEHGANISPFGMYRAGMLEFSDEKRNFESSKYMLLHQIIPDEFFDLIMEHGISSIHVHLGQVPESKHNSYWEHEGKKKLVFEVSVNIPKVEDKP